MTLTRSKDIPKHIEWDYDVVKYCSIFSFSFRCNGLTPQSALVAPGGHASDANYSAHIVFLRRIIHHVGLGVLARIPLTPLAEATGGDENLSSAHGDPKHSMCRKANESNNN